MQSKELVIKSVKMVADGWGAIQTTCQLDDGGTLEFSNYVDEWTLSKGELMGLTRSEAQALWHRRDVAYLQS